MDARPPFTPSFQRFLGIAVLYLSSPFLAAATPVDALLGLPPLQDPHADRSISALGKMLFFDKRLSLDGEVSCASCHLPEQAFSDGKPRSTGHRAQSTTRNAPSLINVGYLHTFFWDGRATSLDSQALAPITNPVEHALPSTAALEKVVRDVGEYRQGFRAAFGLSAEDISSQHIAQALAAYERTLRAGASAFDRYQYGDEKGVLSSAAIRGLALFRGRAQCASCHIIGDTYALFTDENFHIGPGGLPKGVTANLGALARKVMAARTNAQEPEIEHLIATDPDIAALGRFNFTQDPRDIGAVKTPSLRNVALTAPYMHDGSIKTLEEAIELELYGRGSSLREPILLTVAERADLLAFLRALTSAPRDFQ